MSDPGAGIAAGSPAGGGQKYQEKLKLLHAWHAGSSEGPRFCWSSQSELPRCISGHAAATPGILHRDRG
jgi:hypothetical protein